MKQRQSTSQTTSNSDMRAEHFEGDNASKYVTRPSPKMSWPKILILHIIFKNL